MVCAFWTTIWFLQLWVQQPLFRLAVRIVDANIQHAIAFAKLMVKDKRAFPQLNAEEVWHRVNKSEHE